MQCNQPYSPYILKISTFLLPWHFPFILEFFSFFMKFKFYAHALFLKSKIKNFTSIQAATDAFGGCALKVGCWPVNEGAGQAGLGLSSPAVAELGAQSQEAGLGRSLWCVEPSGSEQRGEGQHQETAKTYRGEINFVIGFRESRARVFVCACACMKASKNICGQLIHRILKLTVLHANTDVNTQRYWAPGSFCLQLPPQAADWVNKPQMIFCVQFVEKAWKSRLVSLWIASLSYRQIPEAKNENFFKELHQTDIRTLLTPPHRITHQKEKKKV